jgi:hypothetical protein
MRDLWRVARWVIAVPDDSQPPPTVWSRITNLTRKHPLEDTSNLRGFARIMTALPRALALHVLWLAAPLSGGDLRCWPEQPRLRPSMEAVQTHVSNALEREAVIAAVKEGAWPAQDFLRLLTRTIKPRPVILRCTEAAEEKLDANGNQEHFAAARSEPVLTRNRIG